MGNFEKGGGNKDRSLKQAVEVMVACDNCRRKKCLSSFLFWGGSRIHILGIFSFFVFVSRRGQ
jgi:hypothetical protein